MAENLVYFLSDCHLGARYFDNPIEAERRVVRFLDSIKDSASEIYLLGDILDYWYEYRYVVPRGFVRFLGKLAELSDRGIKIHWFIGNHDIWIFDYLPNELGIEVIDGCEVRDILGKRFFLNHGDAVGKRKASFRFIRSLFRNRICQKLFAAIHPRWTIPFAHGWSLKSRKSKPQPLTNGMTTKIASGLENLIAFSNEYATTHPDIQYYIYGHLHTVCDKTLNNGAHCIVLGDWIHHFSYAVFDGNEVTLKYFKD